MEVKTRLTTEEFFKLYPEESRLELIDGEVYEMPAPTPKHQRIVRKLVSAIGSYVDRNSLGDVYPSPIDVVFSPENVLQPDVVYVSDLSMVKDRIYGSPDLIIEIVSPSSLKRDLTDKMKLYEKHGVKEYWLVFPLEKTIMVYELKDNSYELLSYATEKGKVKSKVLEGFEMEVEEVFGGL